MKAPEILKQAARHIEDRAKARDQPEGERSMGKTVAAFNAITGNSLSERDGWVFMQVLKLARACNTASGLADDYEDAAAYAALAGEAASWKPDPVGEIDRSEKPHWQNFSRDLPVRSAPRKHPDCIANGGCPATAVCDYCCGGGQQDAPR